MAQAGFEEVELVVRTMAQTAVDNETYFCELDAVVGDGDFGYSLARGFEIVLADWDDIDRTDVATFLRKVAVILTSRIGGTSGPIWGTAFLRAGGAAAAPTRSAPTRPWRCSGPGSRASSSAATSDLGDKTLLDCARAGGGRPGGAPGGGGRPRHRARGGGRGRQGGGGGHPADARQARPGRLHG